MTIHAGGLLTLIRARYPGPEWAVLDELHDGTGAAANRRFDAVAFNCWPSRGFVRLGFEIKVSRGDFARELGDHAKRAALEQHCHEVYFVVGPGVCAPRDVPEPWGLLEVRGERLHCTRKAQHRKVGAVAETLAVCAIRRLSEAAEQAEKRTYRFAGEEVTQADINERVVSMMSGARDHIERIRADAAKEHEQAKAVRLAAERDAAAWSKIWQQLQAAAHGRQPWHHATASGPPPTTEQLREAIAQVRAQGAAGVENDLRSLHGRLGALLEAMPRREVGPLDVPE